jgi:DNA polymerase-1
MPSSLPPAGAANVLYLIDLSGYVFRAYHAIAPLSSTKGEPTHAVLGTVNMLQKVVNERRPHMLAVAMDSRGPSFRKEIDARYKATRPAPPPDLAMQMNRARSIVTAYNIPIHQMDGIEADDLIACVIKKAREHGIKTVIVSADKDMMQLVHDADDSVVLWDSMRDKVYGPEEVRAKFGVAPSKMRDFLALTGDTSDNVPGVPSVGPKTAADLLNEFATIDGIYANVEKIKRGKLKEMLQKHEADARVSQKLVTLNAELPISFDLEQLAYGGANKDELRRLFTELEFTRLLDTVKPETKITREYVAVLEMDRLKGALERARATGRLGIAVMTTSSEATKGDVLGVALSTAPGEGLYLPVAHRYLGAPAQLSWSSVKDALRPLLHDPKVTKVGHGLKFSEVALASHGLTIDGPIFDTLLAVYLIDPETPSTIKELARRELNLVLERYEDGTAKARAMVPFEQLDVEKATSYAAADAEVPVTLSERFEQRIDPEGLGKLFREVELPLSRVLAQMELAGVLVDCAYLEKVGKRLEGELRQLETEAKAIAKHDFAIRSRDQLEKILFDELKLRVLKRTPKGGRSTDAEVLEELAEEHPLPRVIVQYRELDKLKGTYVDALPKCVNAKTGRIHTRFDQAVAATGRLSSSDPNLQNIPIRTEVGREIRQAFVAPPGFKIVSADYSQIELRILAHLSNDPELIRAFTSGDDVHTHTASVVFGVPKTEVTRDMRAKVKAINFGIIYGMGDNALAKQINATRDEAGQFIKMYFERYRGVQQFLEKTVEQARRGEAVRTLMGRRRFLPNLHSPNRGLRFEAERVAKNTPIQGTAADILKMAMVKLGAREIVPDARMILTVHDELVFEVPDAHVKSAMGRIKEEMEGALKLAVPLVVEVGSGTHWGDAH